MSSYQTSVLAAYKERRASIIIGLTGRTGSGCSTVASILNTPDFGFLDLHEPKSLDYKDRDERKYEVIYKYLVHEDAWRPFAVVEGSSIIFSFVIQHGYESLCKYFSKYENTDESNNIRISAYKDLLKAIKGLEYIYDKSDLCNIDQNIDDILRNKDLIDKYYDYYIHEIPLLKRDFMKTISEYTCHKEYVDKFSQTKYKKSHLYTFIMQEIANNIRSSGNPYISDYTQNNFYDVAKRMDNIIQLIKKYNEVHNIDQSRICIDAIRNPYEAYYFKDKYSSFYLVSVNTEDDSRQLRLGNLDDDELESLDLTEYPLKSGNDYEIFYHQNMQECLAISDIHIYNPQIKDGKYYFLTEQLIKYVCLMLHPGLITPTHVERCMQIAYNAKLNSGCISRQVGAAITGEDYSVKAIGWNDVPEGQVPCNLRDIRTYYKNRDIETFSEFELENKEFQEALSSLNREINKCDLCGLSFPYCFKDVYNSLKNDKNQVYTRSLHAEENAFLQLTKNGGQGIKGGCLFTTASPCELCSKKAYQLGIKNIYYIDPYPGISLKHILKFGESQNPEMHLFFGAVGYAYLSLYMPRMAQKDELNLISGINCKKSKEYMEISCQDTITVKDIKYVHQKSSFVFSSRTSIYCIEEVEIEALHDDIKRIPQRVYWSGSSYEGMEILHCDRAYSSEIIQENKSPYINIINFDKPLNRGEHVAYSTKIIVKDSKFIMSPYYAQLVAIKTDKLVIEVQSPSSMLENVEFVIYADINMTPDLEISRIPASVVDQGESGIDKYTYEIDHPNLMYSYCIEWKFNN